MAGSTDNPRIWAGADVYDAPVGTTAPTDTTTALVAAWKPLGLLSEDGLTESRSDDITKHFAWGGVHVRTTRSKHERALTVTALEDNPVVFALVNPGSTAVTATGTTTRTVKVPVPNPRALLLELTDGTTKRRRVVPRCEVVEVGDLEISDSTMEMKELTIDVYAAADKTLYIDITNDPQAAVV